MSQYALDSEPLTVGEREAMLRDREREWSDGGDVMLAIGLEQRAVGSSGLHRRVAPDGLEIGYWIHPSITGRGLATEAARLPTDGAFTVEGITYVEIHHDKANRASAGVPRRPDYQLIAEAQMRPRRQRNRASKRSWRVDCDTWMRREA